MILVRRDRAVNLGILLVERLVLIFEEAVELV
jgi:hypothetical protein